MLMQTYRPGFVFTVTPEGLPNVSTKDTYVVIDVRYANPLTTPAFDDGAIVEELRNNWTKKLLSK